MKTRREYNGIKLNRLMRVAMDIWERDPSIVRSKMIEDRRFREFFGCSAVVVLSVWRILQLSLQTPYDGKPNHFLWVLFFMKVYPKEGVMCTIIKVKDPKTFRGRVKYFISAIADLESDVVSNLFPLIVFVSRVYFLNLLVYFRISSIIG